MRHSGADLYARIKTRLKHGHHNQIRRRTTHDVLEGVADNVKSSRLGRFLSAIFSTTVQELHPTARQMERLAKASTIKDHQTDSTFGTCYLAWRHENLSIAALAMVLRVGFTIWSVVLDFQSVSTFELTCRNSICNVTGECNNCSLDGSCLPKVSDAQLRDLRANGACPAYLGIAPSKTFPLIPDHMRAAMTSYHAMVLAQTTIRLACEISAIACVWFAWGAFFHFRRSQVWVRVAFGFALVPPFVLALTFPLQSGINTELFLERTCHDMTSLISSPGATPNATQWVLNLNLPSRAAFCGLPPAQYVPPPVSILALYVAARAMRHTPPLHIALLHAMLGMLRSRELCCYKVCPPPAPRPPPLHSHLQVGAQV